MSSSCKFEKKTFVFSRICMLPKTTKRNYHVLFARLHITEPAQFILDDAIKMLFMVIDSHLHNKGMTAGMVFLFDMQGVTLGHLTRINLSSVRKYFIYVQVSWSENSVQNL